ncbi:MAG: hypothetical protein OXU77_14785 [Gammaproteobacteria bacterium]|nr:hypothetical protein [Gammaproteobacteria bacterium]
MKSLLLGLVGVVALPAFAGPDEFPRTASGKPDFSGRYDIATLTPYTRRGGAEAPQHIDAEAAAQWEDGAVRRYENSMRDRDPNRGPPPKGANVDARSYDPVWFDQGLKMFEIGGRIPTSIIVDPPNGQLPQASEAAIARYRAWQESRDESRGRYDNPEEQSLQDRCLYLGHVSIPALPVVYNNIKTIVQTEDHVMILIEWMHWARVARLNAKHLPDDMRSLAGDSIGWWEDDTLVVETTNFFSRPGVPEEGKRVVERFSPLTKDSLLYRFTVHDPNRTAPYTGEMPWPRTESKMYEYACHEGNYSMFNTLRGARAQERAALALEAESSDAD